jgi:hypothetical protein
MTTYDPITDLERIGYTPREAAFLYLVGNNSGFFLRRQFLFFLQRKLGSLAQNFIEKAIRNQHIAALDYGQRRHIYHLNSRTIYRFLGDTDSPFRRPRGDHEITNRLMILDFVLERIKDRWLSTEAQKVEFFQKELKISSECFPRALGRTNGESATVIRYFPDRFPIALVQVRPNTNPFLRFVYFDEGLATVKAFERYLRGYHELFFNLPAFELVYVSVSSRNFIEAERLFKRLVSCPESPASKALLPFGLPHLIQYFKVRRLWDRSERDYSSPNFAVLKEGKQLYDDIKYEFLYGDWYDGEAGFEKELERRGLLPKSANGRFASHLINESYPVFGYKNAGSW